MIIKGLKFEAEGNCIYVLNDVGHNLFALKVQPGCLCTQCRDVENQVRKGSDSSDLTAIAEKIACFLNR